MREERSIGALLMALVTLAILGGAYVEPWFEYDHSSGRQVAPDGPHDEDGVERTYLDVYATSYEGDVEPTDPALLERVFTINEYLFMGAAGLLALVVLGEIPFIARLIPRPLSLVFLFFSMMSIATMTVLSWNWIPEAMSGYGVTGPYTAFLEEPNGYTTTTMAPGFYLFVISVATYIAAYLFKYQAGEADPAQIPAMARRIDGRKGKAA